MNPSQTSKSLIRLAKAVDDSASPSRSFVVAALNSMILALNMDVQKMRTELEGVLGHMDVGKLPKKAKLNAPTLQEVGRELGINVYVGLKGNEFMAFVNGESAYEAPVSEFSPSDAASALTSALMGAIGGLALN